MFGFSSESIIHSVKNLWGMLNNYGIYDDVVYSAEKFIPQDALLDTKDNLRKEIYLGLVKLSEGDEDLTAEEFINRLKSKYPNDSDIIQDLETFTQSHFPETDDPFFVPKISGCEYKNLVNTLENHFVNTEHRLANIEHHFVDARHCLARIGTVHGSLMQCLASTTLAASLKNSLEIISNTAGYIYNHPAEILLNGLALSVNVFQVNRIVSASHFGSSSIMSGTGAVLAVTTFSQQFALTEAAFPAAYDLNNLNSPSINAGAGVIFQGRDIFDQSGTSVRYAGDVNKDGFADMLIGASHAGPLNRSQAGETYLLFGHNGPWPAVVDLMNLNGSNGVVFQGRVSGDWSGHSVSAAGDVNKDGFADMLIGAQWASPLNRTEAGETYLLFGHDGTWPAAVDLATLNGSNGVVFQGRVSGDGSGYSVSAAGDVNNDGFADILIGALLEAETGETYLLFGHGGTWPPAVDLAILNGSNGVVFQSGLSVSSAAGDVNNDGFADILIGVSSANPLNRTWAGETYLLFGHNGTWPAAFDLRSINGSNGVVFQGRVSGDWSGYSVSAAGDVNKDGFADILIGVSSASPLNRDNAGETYLLFGHNGAWPAAFDLRSINGSNGVVFQGRMDDDRSGISVSTAGDVNNDGFADMLIGASEANPLNRGSAGETYLLFGHGGTWPAAVDLATLFGSNGVVFQGRVSGDSSGSSVSTAGDVNNDGFADILIGAFWAAPLNRDAAGETYLLWGSPTPPSILVYLNNKILSYTENDAGIMIASEITINDFNSFSIHSAAVSISRGFVNGEDILEFSVQNGITGIFNNQTGVLTLSGSASKENYQAILRSVTYRNISENPSLNIRAISIVVNDGLVDSNIILRAVSITPVNDAPLLFSADEAINYRQNDPAIVIVMDVALTDVDNTIMQSATISISDGFVKGEDQLSFSNQNNINATASLNGVLMLSGNAFIADYETALRAVTYRNVATNFSESNRTISIQVSDGIANSNVSMRTLNILPFNNTGKPNTNNNKASVDDNIATLLAILLPIAGTAICAIAGSLVGFYLWRHYRIKKRNDIELSSIRQNKFTIVGGRFELVNKINQDESLILEQQTGIKVTFVEGKKKTKFMLGQGQFGKLRLARVIETGQYIGVKKVKGDNKIEASEKEASIQKKLNGLPNIMPLIESLNITGSDENPVLYQFMPLAGFGNGEVLTKYLQENTDIILRDKIRIHVMKSLVIGCQSMHSRNIYHNDLKPSNFVIDQKGNVFIIDFGCSEESTKPMLDSVIGDTGYFSPDRLIAYKEKRQFNAAKSDAWALGVTMLEIVLGKYPFDRESADLRVRYWNNEYFQNKFKEIAELQNPAVTSIWDLIKGLLETDPNKRFSIEAVLQHPALNNTVLQFASEDEISASLKLLQGTELDTSKAPVLATQKPMPKDEDAGYVKPILKTTMPPSSYPTENDNNNNNAMLKSPYPEENDNDSAKQRDSVSSNALQISGMFAQTAANSPIINRYDQTALQQMAINMQQH